MIKDTIEEIEARIRTAGNVDEPRRRELLGLLATLKTEVSDLSRTHGDQARSIAGFVGVSAHEATRADRNPRLLGLSLEGLGASAAGFEESHPRLTEMVSAISRTLSNLGI